MSGVQDPTPPPRILVVEDDASLAAGLVRGLGAAGFQTELCTRGDLATEALERFQPALVVLDLMLPGASGHELLQAWASRHRVPVIVLTAKVDLDDRLRSFELGAVDFLPKPFWIKELLARIRARLRLDDPAPTRRVAWADVEVDLDHGEVERLGKPLDLTAHERNVLLYLAGRPDRPLSRSQIASATLSADGAVSDRTVDSHVARLRKKLGPDAGKAIETVWGIGYRFRHGGAEAQT